MNTPALQYLQLTPNFRIIVRPVTQYGVKYGLHMTAGGAFFEEKNQLGLSHLLEHCIVSRTKDMDSEEFKQYLFQKDIDNNAFTGRLWMDFVFSGHKEDSDILLDLILKFGFEPYLTQEVLDREKEIVLREMAQYSGGPGYRLNRTLIEAMFEENSFSRCEVLGSREDVQNASLEEFYKIQKRIFAKSHFVLTAVGGGLEIDKIKDKIKKYLPLLKSENTLPINFQPKNYLKEFKYLPVVNDLGHDHAVVKITVPCPVTLDNRPVRAYIRELLFEHPIGYLYNKLRNELGYIYSLQYMFDISSDSMSLELACEIEHLERIVVEVKKAFSNFDLIFSNEKINIIRQLLVKRRELNEDDPEFGVDFTTNILSDFGVLVYYEDYIKFVEQVTLDDIKVLYNTIKENLDRMQIIVVSNKKEIEGLNLR